MDKIFISEEDRVFINTLTNQGLKTPGEPQWRVARLAFTRSIQLASPPDESFDDIGSGKKGELHLQQITGLGKGNSQDFTDYFKLLLSEYHEEDMFKDSTKFVQYLRRHIRRGLHEFKTSWRPGYNFHDYLIQEMVTIDTTSASSETNTLTERLATALKEVKIHARLQEVIDGPRIDRYIYQLESVNDYEKIRRSMDNIEHITALSPLSLVLNIGERLVGIDVPRAEEDWIFPSVKEISLRELTKGELPVAVGVDVTGHPVQFDLAEAPHLFVAGTTGSGKSYCLHAIIYSLLLNSTNIQLVLADPKQVEFAQYSTINKLWNGKVLTEAEEIVSTLEDLVSEMEKRQTTLFEGKFVNIEEAQTAGVKMPRIVVIIEELADLFLQDDRAKNFCIRLAQKARATGIHLVLATQRPDADTFPGLLRSNIPSRIALSVRTSRESKIIIDEVGAERLLGKGDMIIRTLQGQPVRAHGYRIEKDDIDVATLSQSEKNSNS